MNGKKIFSKAIKAWVNDGDRYLSVVDVLTFEYISGFRPVSYATIILYSILYAVLTNFHLFLQNCC